MMNKDQCADGAVANFVQKAFDIISDQNNSDIIQWLPNGKEFFIKNIEQFQEIILPNYFRHRNINSFIRQLNMYGFHKSRKEPSKNIFSHPFFQRDKRQSQRPLRQLLTQVKRKIKLIESSIQTPQKPQAPDQSKNQEGRFSTTKLQKQTVQKEQKEIQPIISSVSINLKSQNNLEKDQVSPFKNFMISKSFILDINPEACLKLRQNNSFIAQEDDEDDNLSIADQINRERQRFNNRTQGISIVKTSNFISEFQL